MISKKTPITGSTPGSLSLGKSRERGGHPLPCQPCLVVAAGNTGKEALLNTWTQWQEGLV